MARFLKDRHKTKGAAPGSLIFIGQQKVAQRTVQLIRYTPDGIKESAPSAVDKIRSAVSDDHITWINVSGVHDTDFIAQLGNAFNISPLILEDIVNTDQRPRFSEETDHLYIIAKSFYIGDDDRRVHMEQISMIVGEHCKEGDLVVNVQKGKQLTNMRAAGSDRNLKIVPARKMSLEQALEYIEDDELVEVTPKNIRLRKFYLTELERRRMRGRSAAEA